MIISQFNRGYPNQAYQFIYYKTKDSNGSTVLARNHVVPWIGRSPHYYNFTLEFIT